MEDAELKKVLETLLFITDAPLPVSRIAQLLEIKNKERIEGALQELRKAYDDEGRTLQVMQVAGGWQFSTRPEYGIWVRKLYNSKMTVRLTQAALETLCIIAYKQPITRAEIEAIRGVEVIGPLETLTQRKLITVVGRRETIGRPIMYGTTNEFLRQFGLNSLDDMPKLESFNIENVAAGAQATAVELVEEETAVETVAEGEPPADPMAGAQTEPQPEQPVQSDEAEPRNEVEPQAETAEQPVEQAAEQPAAAEQPSEEQAVEAAPEGEPREGN